MASTTVENGEQGQVVTELVKDPAVTARTAAARWRRWLRETPPPERGFDPAEEVTRILRSQAYTRDL
jgi:hypothetical protein